MNILIPDSWLREYLTTDATPKDIQKCLSLCGPSVERLNQVGKDWIYDIEVTTNRVDCMSVIGIAREAAAILPQFGYKTAFRSPSLKFRRGNKGEVLKDLEIINNPSLCHRLLALPVYGVEIKSASSEITDRLEKVGQRCLNNLVDITNYVMWTVGHPVHVFDLDRISPGQMVIREAKKGEQITTLDEKTYTLTGGEVIIDNGYGKIIDLPSIMGTANSVVTPETKNVLFFIDDIIPAKVRFASMTHGIRTQAATLMEKGVDPQLGPLAISQIVSLMAKHLPEAKIGSLIDIYPHTAKSKSISLSLSQISDHISVEFTTRQVAEILTSLGFEVSVKSKDLKVTPPSFRSRDITIWQDLVEEVARIYGYHNIPSILMSGSLPRPVFNESFTWESHIKSVLKYQGFTEIYTYSLVEKDTGLELKNPLTTDWQYLRTSLFPSHAKVIAENIGRVDHLDLFEIANVYLPQTGDLPDEQLRLIITTTHSDYYRFKGIIEALLADLGISHLQIDIRQDEGVLYWEEPLDLILAKASKTKSYTPISKFSPIYEDINVIHNKPFAEIVAGIKKISPLISQVDLIDKYNDKLTLRLTFHSDTKQLSSEDISPIREQLMNIS